MAEDCVFCKMAAGEIKPLIVYEDDLVMAFLDQNPVIEGHTLVIPKEHYVDLFDIPAEVMGKIGEVTADLTKKYKEKLGLDGMNLFNSSGTMAGQAVMHFHLHLAPRKSGDGIRFNFHDTAQVGVDLKGTYEKIMNG